jgi:hypothetical protein
MQLIERYKNGETIEVYQHIYALGDKAFEPDIFQDVKSVLSETFKRVKYNLEVIYKALVEMNYRFNTDFSYTSNRPLAEPLNNCETLLQELDENVRPFGFIPLSFRIFYQIVGSCNFSWDYKKYPEIYWEYADPIQVMAIDDVVRLMAVLDWKESMLEILEDSEDACTYIPFSADFYHKDNVSGGEPYAIEITKHKSIDSRVLFEGNETTFIHYLRLNFEKCGFTRIDNPNNSRDYDYFFDKVKPQLIEI